MTRTEETACVAALRAAFAASDEPDVFRWFARRSIATVVSAVLLPHKECKTPSECIREQVCFDPWHCSCNAPDNHQSAAEPPQDRKGFAWDVIGEEEF